MRSRRLIILALVFTLFILTVPAQMLASAAVRPWGGSVGSWEDAIKEWQGTDWKDQPSSSAEQQWLEYLKQHHPELYEQYINEWLNEVKKTDPALYEQYMKQWKNGQGDFSPFDGTLSPLDGNYLKWQQLKLREMSFNTLAPTYNGPLGAILQSLLMTGSLFAPKGMELFSIFNRTVSGDNNAFSLFAPLSPQELMMNQLLSLSLMKGIHVTQTSSDGKSEAKGKQTASASNKGGTITESKQEDKPWYKKAGDWMKDQYKSVKDAVHSNPVTGEIWDFFIADAEGTITGVDPVTGEKLSGMGRTYNIATTFFKPLKVVDKISDGANAAKKAEKIEDTKKQGVGRKENQNKDSNANEKEKTNHASVAPSVTYAEKTKHFTNIKGNYSSSVSASHIVREELKLAGIKPPPYPNAAHHIIPWNDKRASTAQRILKEFDIDLNSAANGVFLPYKGSKYVGDEAIHRGNHSKEYIQHVTDELLFVKENGGTKEDMLEVINDVRKGLLDGSVKLNE